MITILNLVFISSPVASLLYALSTTNHTHRSIAERKSHHHNQPSRQEGAFPQLLLPRRDTADKKGSSSLKISTAIHSTTIDTPPSANISAKRVASVCMISFSCCLLPLMFKVALVPNSNHRKKQKRGVKSTEALFFCLGVSSNIPHFLEKTRLQAGRVVILPKREPPPPLKIEKKRKKNTIRLCVFVCL